MTPKNYLENVVLKTWDGKGTQEQCFYGFLEEFGEITGKLKKAHRDDVPEQEKQAGLKKELGDWGWYIIHLGYLRKSIDFNQQQFKPDNLQTNKKPQQVIMSISSKIGMMVNGMAEGNKHKERTAMRSLVNSFTDLSNSLGFTTEVILQANTSKLFDRMARGKMHGSGDER